MVAFPPLLNESDIRGAIQFAQQVQSLRPEIRQHADGLRVAAFEVREDAKRIATFPDQISPAEFADMRQRVTKLLEASAFCLESTATMLTALVGTGAAASAQDPQ